MTSEVIVDVQPKEISIALLEDKRLVEYQREGRTENFSVGNIYAAKVRKLMPGLNACFVSVGHERDAFLHYLDLGSGFSAYEKYLELLGDAKRNPSMGKCMGLEALDKDGSIQNTLKVGQEVLRGEQSCRGGCHAHPSKDRYKLFPRLHLWQG
jgi:ribonuclease G